MILIRERIATQSYGSYVDSDTILAQREKLGVNPNGLTNVVGLFGTTLTDWREKLIGPLIYEDINVYNPQLAPDAWQYDKHAKPESFALTSSSVLVFRLENQQIIDGSQGSIGEIGKAVLSALLHGQRLIISIETNFSSTMQSPSAVSQICAMNAWLTELSGYFPDYIKLSRGNDMDKLRSEVRYAYSEQQERPLPVIPVPDLAHAANFDTNVFSVLSGGSSGGFSEDMKPFVARMMEHDNEHILSGTVNDLRTDRNSEEWGLLYQRMEEEYAEHKAISEKTRDDVYLKYIEEIGRKLAADLVIWHISPFSVSTAAVTELGYMLALRMIKGKQTVVLIEDFSPGMYIQEKIREKRVEIETKLNDLLSATEMVEEYRNRLLHIQQEMLKVWEGKSTLVFKEFKPLIGIFSVIEDYMKADTIRRVRTLAKEHIERIHEYQKTLLDQNPKQLPGIMFYLELSVKDFRHRIETLTAE